MIPIGLENRRRREFFLIEGNPLDNESSGSIELFSRKFIHQLMHFYLMAEPMGPIMANNHFTGTTETQIRQKQTAVKFGNKILIYSARLWQRYSPLQVKKNVVARSTQNGRKVNTSTQEILVPDVITSLEISHHPHIVKRRLQSERPPQQIAYDVDKSLYLVMLILADGRVFVPWGSYEEVARKLNFLPGFGLNTA